MPAQKRPLVFDQLPGALSRKVPLSSEQVPGALTRKRPPNGAHVVCVLRQKHENFCLKEHDIANLKRHLESSRIAKADRDRCRDPMRGPQPHEAGLRPKSGLRRRCLRLRAGRSPTRRRHTAALFSLLRLCEQLGDKIQSFFNMSNGVSEHVQERRFRPFTF